MNITREKRIRNIALVAAVLTLVFGGHLACTARSARAAEQAVTVVAAGELAPVNPRSKRHAAETGSFEQRPATKLIWRAGSNPLMEALATKRPALYAYKEGVELSIAINTDGFPGLSVAGLRVIDLNGEIHQFGKLRVPEGRGWKTWRVSLDPQRATDHWSGSDTGRGRIDAPVRLLSVLLKGPGETVPEERFVLIGEITRNPFDPGAVEPEESLRPVNVMLETGYKPHTVKVGQENNALFVLSLEESARPVALDFSVRFSELSVLGREPVETEPMRVKLKPGSSLAVPMPSLLTRTGWIKAAAVLKVPGSDAVVVKPATAFAYIVPAGNRKGPSEDGFLFGIDARLRDPNQQEWIAESAAMIGADYLRGGVTWPGIQPDSGDTFDWEKHGNVLDILARHGLHVQYGLCFTPPWAAREKYVDQFEAQQPGTEGPVSGRRGAAIAARAERELAAALSRTPPRLDAWRNFIRNVVKFNKSRGVFAYEIWNEPDLRGFWTGTTDEYLEILRAAYEEIKAIDPDAVVFSGFAQMQHHGHDLNPKLIHRSYVEAQDHYDAIGLHRHGDFASFQADVDGALQTIRDQLAKDKPLFFSETGMPVHGSREHVEQVYALVKKISFARARGAMAFSWFVLPAGGFDEYSMINTRTNEPWPVFCAYNELVKLMRGKRFGRQHDVGPGNWLLQFDGRDESLLVGWEEDAATEGQAVLLRMPDGATAQRVDLMGNASAADAFKGIVTWTSTKEPQYLRVIGGRPELLGSLARFTGEIYGEPQRPVTASAVLTNPLPRTASFEIAWTTPDGKTQQTQLPVSAGETREATLQMVMPVTQPGEPKPRLKLAYALLDTPWQGQLELVLNAAAQVIPSGPVDERPPDFVLDTKDNVFNANENDPSREDWTWKGPQDLSAKIWLSLERKHLVLKVDVADEKHMQPNAAEASWKADGVQLGIVIPGRKGYWDIGLARRDDGESMASCWHAPVGCAADYAGKVELKITPRPGGMTYLARLPLDGLGADADLLKQKALGLNLLVNDEDGGGREGFCFLAEGLGRARTPETWPLLRFE